MPHVSPTLATITLDLALVTSPHLSLVISGHMSISDVALSLGSLATGASTLTASQTLTGPLPWGFWLLWAPLTGTISCYCILTHLNQGSWIRASTSGSAPPSWWGRLLLTTHLWNTGGVVLFLFMLTFNFSRCSHQSYVIIQRIVKWISSHRGFLRP